MKSGDQVWIRDGRTLRLGHRLGEGGEGAVYELEGEPTLVAKIYTQRPKPSQQHKLDALIGLADTRITEMTAWPTMIVRQPGQAATIGFTMPRLDGHRPVHELYTPKSRRLKFPEYDFGEVLKVCHNVAIAMHRVHEKGCVIGDVNEGNVFVGRKASVRLIDCDSFQVPATGHSPFLCEVGVPGFTPPELQSNPQYDSHPRTTNHDAFGLAILIFHLIFLGRHPFAGKPTGSEDYALEDAIREHRFAYGPGAPSRGLVRPNNIPMPDLDLVGPLIGKMFETAFLPSSRQRPTPEEWAKAMRLLHGHLKVCTLEEGHQFPNHLASCPWCAVEQATSLILFPIRSGSGPDTARFDIDRIEKEINLVRLEAPPSIVVPKFDRKINRSPRILLAAGAISIVIGLMGAGATMLSLLPLLTTFGYLVVAFGIFQVSRLSVLAVLGPKIKPLEKLQREIAAAHAALGNDGADKALSERKAELNRQIRELKELPALFQARVTERHKQAREIQLQQFLDRFSIRSQKIRRIGPATRMNLAAAGIDTAWDVHQLRVRPKITRFGDAGWLELKAWADGCASRFVFDSKRALPPEALIGITRDVQQRQRTLETQISSGLRELKALAETATLSRKRAAERVAEMLAQRDAKAKELGRWLA